MALVKKLAYLLALGAGFMLLLAGCGVKGLPSPMVMQNPPKPVLSVKTIQEGVEVSFTVPRSDKADKVIREVIFHYAYLPLEGDPACPECPPVLNATRTFSLSEKINVGEEGRFAFIDTEAPYGQRALYQAIMVDGAGRRSQPSNITRGYVLNLPPAPLGVQALTLEEGRQISWQETPPLNDPDFDLDTLGYIVERQGPEGIVRLNATPMTSTLLNDFTANPSRTYRYRVISARVLETTVLVQGEPGGWVKAAPFGRVSSLLPPTDLVAVSVPEGVYLRFEPVQDPETRGYLIERRQGQASWQGLNDESIVENTYIDRQLVADTYYEYRVSAVDVDGDLSQPSEAARVLYQPQEEEEQ